MSTVGAAVLFKVNIYTLYLQYLEDIRCQHSLGLQKHFLFWWLFTKRPNKKVQGGGPNFWLFLHCEMMHRVARNIYFFPTSKTWWHPEKIGHGFASWWSILPPSFYATDFVKLISFIKVIQRFSSPFLHRLCKFIVFDWKKISESL